MLQYSKGNSGFTLLELLIAIVIFAVILTTIYSSYTGTFRIIDETESQAEIYRMARIAMERMLEDLESVYVQKDNENTGSEGDRVSPFQFVGEEQEISGRRADTLRFISRAHIDFSGKNPGHGTTQIRYFVREDNGGEHFILYRSDNPLFRETYPFDEGSGGLPLCEKLVSVAFNYYGEEGEIFGSWDSSAEGMENKLPKAVSILLEFENTLSSEIPVRFMTSVALPVEHAYL